MSSEVRRAPGIGVTDDCGLSFACEEPNPGALRVTITGQFPVWHLLKAITAAVHGGRPRTPTLRRLESKDTLSKLEDTVSKIDSLWPGVLVCAVIPALWSQKQADRRVQGQPGKHSEFQTRLCYVTRPCLKKRRDGRRGAGKEKKIIPCFKVLF